MAKIGLSIPGSKAHLAKYILPLFGPHTVYVEVFGGIGAILFAKPPSKFEVYNDIDSRLINAFKVLKYKADELKEYIIPLYSRELFEESLTREPENEIEAAAFFFISLIQSYNTRMTNWSRVKKTQSRRGSWFYFLKQIDFIKRRLQNVEIENMDFRDLIKKYDQENALMYIDPPYLGIKSYYKYSMTEKDHEELVKLLLNCKSQTIISGYEHPIYNPLEENGWKKMEIQHYTRLLPAQKEKRIEVIWYKTKCLSPLL